MEELMKVATLELAALVSFPLGLLLTWLWLCGAFRLMPAGCKTTARRVTPEAPLTARRGPAQWAVVHAKELPRDLNAGSSR